MFLILHLLHHSAGKSFVAEVLMLRRVMSTGKMALLVLPYVSICAEKVFHLVSSQISIYIYIFIYMRLRRSVHVCAGVHVCVYLPLCLCMCNLFITAPVVSLLQAEHLEGLLDPLGKHVRSFYGNQGGGTLPKDTSVAVCTIEKANSLVNRLLEEGRLPEVGIIVIDELHMVNSLFVLFGFQ